MTVRFAAWLMALTMSLPAIVFAQDISSPAAPLFDCTDRDTCRYSIDFTAQEASYRLGDKSLTYWIEGDLIRIAARADSENVKLCCTFQAVMTPLGGDGGGKLWGAVYRVPAMDQSIISIRLPAVTDEVLVYRGPKAPPAPDVADTLQGEIVEVHAESRLPGKRTIHVYKPKAPPPETGYPVVYLADGISVHGYARIVDKLIADGKIKPLLLIGMASGNGPPLPGGTYDLRNREYIPVPGAIGEDYLNHEAFVLDTVMPLAEGTFHASRRPQDRMTSGFSSGATWALSFALRHRDRIQSVAAFSIGMPASYFDFGCDQPLALYLEAGRFEPHFLTQTEAVCRKAIASQIECGVMKLYAGHDAEAWTYAFAETVKIVFKP